MTHVRRLAAIDIAFLGSKFVLIEFALAIIALPGLGLLSLIRGHATWQVVLGAYMLLLGLNYVPLLLYAIAITRNHSAREELGSELDDREQAMRKYRRFSLLLLVPFAMPILAMLQSRDRQGAVSPNHRNSQ